MIIIRAYNTGVVYPGSISAATTMHALGNHIMCTMSLYIFPPSLVCILQQAFDIFLASQLEASCVKCNRSLSAYTEKMPSSKYAYVEFYNRSWSYNMEEGTIATCFVWLLLGTLDANLSQCRWVWFMGFWLAIPSDSKEFSHANQRWDPIALRWFILAQRNDTLSLKTLDDFLQIKCKTSGHT